MKILPFWSVLVLISAPAYAEDVASPLLQLNHKAWAVATGAPSVISSIAQTTDGTLWLGGANGLSRFDGIRFVREYAATGAFETTFVRTVAAARDGGLWIGFSLGGISLLKNGAVTHYGERDGLPIASVHSIVTGAAGDPYAATSQGLYHFERDHWNLITVDTTEPQAFISAVAVDRAGTVWAVTDRAVLARVAGASSFREIAKRNNRLIMSSRGFSGAPDGTMWVRNLNRLGGMTRLDARVDSLAGAASEFSFDDASLSPGVLFDRAGNLWMGGDAVRRLSAAAMKGDVKHMAQRIEIFTPAEGLTGRTVTGFYEDREGNVWAGTYAGLDRFSPSNVKRLIVSNPSGGAAAVAGADGTVWASSRHMSSNGMFPVLEIHDGVVTREYPAPAFTSAYRGPDGSIWFGGTNAIARFEGGRFITTPLADTNEVQAMVQDRSGAMWVSVIRKGVFRLADGQWSAYGNLPTLPREPVIVETLDSGGKIWFGYTGNRIARIDGTKVELFGTADGLSVGSVTSIAAGREHVWVGGERGLARFDGARFSSVLSSQDNLFIGVSGIVELAAGDLWLNGNNGIVHVPAEEIARTRVDSSYRVRCEVFDHLDGIPGYAKQLRPTPSAFEGTDGLLWFITENGLVSIDPSHIIRNALPPPVTIWSLSGGGVQYPAETQTVLPALSTSVRIAYTAASLIIPERVRFRYKLEGLEQDWQDAGDRREAVYTNLGPGRYTFRVIAANNDNVWNTTGASLSFAIAPASFQTKWFRSLCVILFLAALAGLYQLRLRQLARQYGMRLEERLSERTRIARELHDTLLQSFQGLLLRFQAVAKRLPEGTERQKLSSVIADASKAIGEGRNAIEHVRSPTAEKVLASGLRDIGEELACNSGEGPIPSFQVDVHGTPRTLRPIARDEIYWMAREALHNAFKHAQAKRIEVGVRYDERQLVVSVRDDGRGIDPEIIARGGRSGHFGLRGMHERSRILGAQLDVWTELDLGTEVEVSIPASVAYESSRLLARFSLQSWISWKRATHKD